MPGTHAAPVGPWNENLNVPLLPGATLPEISAARLAAGQSLPANMLARSRGFVVPSRVELSHDLLPMFSSTMFAAIVSPHLSWNGGIAASGHDWWTNFAAHAGGMP